MIIFFTVLLSVLKNILIFRIYRQKYVKHSSLSNSLGQFWQLVGWNFDSNWWVYFFPFFFRFFWCGPFIKSLLNLLRHCFSFFYVLVFWLRGMWEFSSMTRDGTATPLQLPALEAKVLTAGPPGKPHCVSSFIFSVSLNVFIIQSWDKLIRHKCLSAKRLSLQILILK